MVRSAAAVIAVLIIPSFAVAQEAQGTHTVVKTIRCGTSRSATTRIRSSGA